MIWETNAARPTEDERLSERFTTRETPSQRQRRLASKKVDPLQARAVARFIIALESEMDGVVKLSLARRVFRGGR